MYTVAFDKPVNVFFIGIGGISMSGLAEILVQEGFKVYGSDQKTSAITDRLVTMGATIYQGHDPAHINSNLSFVVYTAAIKSDNPEYMAAMALNIPMIDRATLLGQIMDHYPFSIGVAGTHGKTTTTSMVAHVLESCNLDPTISVGGMLKLINGNIKVGHSEYFVTEACEYANSFFQFRPFIGIVLNIEEDHMDFFQDIHQIRDAFRRYLDNIPKDGYAILLKSILQETDLYQNLECNLITYGLQEDEPDYYPMNITYNELGCGGYDLYHNNEFLMAVQLNSTGEHNVLNSVSVMAMAHLLNLDLAKAALGLFGFSGADRRFEYKGDLMGITIIDDYAHHPSEIDVTIKAARKICKENLWIVFQPHTYTRTKAFLKEFAAILAKADGIILTDIYAAREKKDLTIHSKDILTEIQKINPNAHYFESFDDVQIFVLSHLIPNDMLITMGAGDVYLIGEDLIKG